MISYEMKNNYEQRKRFGLHDVKFSTLASAMSFRSCNTERKANNSVVQSTDLSERFATPRVVSLRYCVITNTFISKFLNKLMIGDFINVSHVSC